MDASADIASLSPRQREVLVLLGKGLHNAEIAALIGIRTVTVAEYVKVVFAKLGVDRRVEAAVIAAKAGLL